MDDQIDIRTIVAYIRRGVALLAVLALAGVWASQPRAWAIIATGGALLLWGCWLSRRSFAVLFDWMRGIEAAPAPPRRAAAQERGTRAAHISMPLEEASAVAQRAPATYYDDNPFAPAPTQAQPNMLRLHDIADDDNILVVGPKGSGKTTLLRALIRIRHGEHKALDPHNAPGKWPCDVFGGGRNFDEIDRMLQGAYHGLNRHYQQLNSGAVREGQFRRHTLVGDEWRAISQELPGERGNPAKHSAGAVLLKVLAEGRKVGICMLAGAHNDTAASMGMAGDMAMLTCFDWIVYLGGLAVRKMPEAARQQYPAVAYHTERDAYALLDISAAPQLAGPIVSTVSPPSVPVQPAQDAGIAPENTSTVQYGTSPAPTVPVLNTGGTALPMDDEAVMVRNLLQQRFSKNKIAEMLGGSKSTAYDRINRATGERA